MTRCFSFRPLALVASLVFLFSTLAPAGALALSPAATDFVRSLGMDPASDPVRSADAEGEVEGRYLGDPEMFSLEALALAKRPTAVRQFVATRWFVRQLKADFAHTALITVDYNSDFLTADERQLVGRKVAMSLLGPG